MAVDVTLAERLLATLDADLTRDGRLGKVRRYLAGDHDLPYMPKGAKKEFEHIAARSITNWTPTIPGTFTRSLFVDGYRAAKTAENVTSWAYWQANGLDARQTIAHRGALEYGTSYTLVLPGSVQGKSMPVIRPLSPLRSLAWYTDPDDEFPAYGLLVKGEDTEGARIFEVYDSEGSQTFSTTTGADGKAVTVQTGEFAHGLGVTPFVRFRDRLDDEATGLVRPILPLQDRGNEVVFSTLIALQYASFRQRWATGLAVPVDEDPDSPTFGQAVEPFQAAVDRLWVSDDPTAKFGDFAQTEISGHLSLYKSTIETLAATSDINPGILMGTDANPASADALAALNDATQRRLGEFETNFGESWETVFRLAALAAGDRAGYEDTSAQVRWRDTEARSMAATVDALGKIASMLQVPVEALWEQIPGVTQQDVEHWKTLRDASDPLALMLGETARQIAPVDTDAPAEETASPDAALDPADLKARADALGVLVRAGMTSASAAAIVGLTGAEFTGAVPTSLRLPEAAAEKLEA